MPGAILERSTNTCLPGKCSPNLTNGSRWKSSPGGNHIIVKVNDEVTADGADLDNISARGSIALQLLRQTVVQFPKIEIKELPPSETTPPLAADVLKDAVLLMNKANSASRSTTR